MKHVMQALRYTLPGTCNHIGYNKQFIVNILLLLISSIATCCLSLQQIFQSNIMRKLLTISVFLMTVLANAQVKIGDNPNTINNNSLLELESSNKGFLTPRVALVSLTSIAPLTGTVPAGMMVYSINGSIADGIYVWDGLKWGTLAQSSMVVKTASATLLTTETFVLALNNINLTLPSVGAAENGLEITIKNVGSHTHQINVAGGSGATIDGIDTSRLQRWLARTFVAYNGNWITKGKEAITDNVLEVCPTGSWTSISEALEFLDLHMTGPSVIRLSDDTFSIAATHVIDLQYPLTIEGVSYGTATLSATSALTGLPMFRCVTESYFKKITFDGTSASSEDAIQLEGAGEYYEIKDCSFEGFSKSIVMETNSELWLFETDITDAESAGVEIAAGTNMFAKLTASECDFTNCAIGINLKSGDTAKTNIVNCTFYNSGSQVGINYIPGVGNFHRFESLFITNNAWNNIGTFISGFDFSLPRDADAFVQNNAGMGDKNPNVYINVTNNSLATAELTSNTVWYKILWDHTKCTSIPTKWAVTNAAGGIANVNRIKYLSRNKNDGYITISGNIISSSASAGVMLSLGLVKNPVGNITSAPAASIVRYGQTTLRPTAAGVPFQFSTVIYLSDIKKDDVFELWVNCSVTTTTITVQDVQMLVNSK